MKWLLPEPNEPWRYAAWLRPSRSALPMMESACSKVCTIFGVIA